MKFKKAAVPGACDTARCKAPSVYPIEGTSYTFCEKHARKYIQEQNGTPPPVIARTTATDPETGSEAAQRGAFGIVPKDVDALTKPIKDEAQSFIEAFGAIVIADENTLNIAVDMLKQVKEQAKDLEAKKKAVTKPMNDAKNEVISWFKPALTVLAEAEKVIKDAISAYFEKQEADKVEALQAGDYATAISIVKADKPEGLGTSVRWEFEIENESLLPREYLCPDLKEIGRVVAEFKDRANIPGVRVFTRTGVSVRTK